MGEIKISRWGNSSAVRLPKSVMDELGLVDGSSVDLKVEGGRAYIEPVQRERYSLDWILAETDRLDVENAPAALDWGQDVGSERFWENE